MAGWVVKFNTQVSGVHWDKENERKGREERMWKLLFRGSGI